MVIHLVCCNQVITTTKYLLQSVLKMGNIFGTKRKRPKNEEAIDNEEERPQVDR